MTTTFIDSLKSSCPISSIPLWRRSTYSQIRDNSPVDYRPRQMLSTPPCYWWPRHEHTRAVMGVTCRRRCGVVGRAIERSAGPDELGPGTPVGLRAGRRAQWPLGLPTRLDGRHHIEAADVYVVGRAGDTSLRAHQPFFSDPAGG